MDEHVPNDLELAEKDGKHRCTPNIDERKRTEEALRQSQERFETLFQFSPIAAALTSAVDGRILDINRHFTEVSGFTREEAIGRTSLEIGLWKEPAKRSEMMEQIKRGGIVRNLEARICGKGGREFDMLISTQFLNLDTGPALLIMANDVTRNKQAEEEIRRLNAQLETRLVALTQPMGDLSTVRFEDLFDLEEIQKIQDALAAACGVASLITDVNGRPLTRPSNFCRLCEQIRKTDKGLLNCLRSDATLGGKHPGGPRIQACLSCGLWEGGTSICVGDRHIANWLVGQVIVEPMDEAALLGYAREIGADETEFREALAQVPRLPRTRFEQICHALYLIAGQLSHLAVQNVQQARFITEQKNAEAARATLEAQLRQAQKMEAIGQLAGGVAHDFNNILGAILLQMSVLQREHSLPREVRDSLIEVASQAKRAASLTRQLLMFGRRERMQAQVLDLDVLLGNLLKMLRRLIGEHITLAFDTSAKVQCVEADPGMLEQVVMNLVVNARDAMPRGGRITLRTSEIRIDSAHAARNSEARPGRFVCLSVADTGSGMDAETIKHIFEPFFTTKEIGKGTGLGLAIVYGIVQQHQGWVEVESTVGQGSVFRIYLPASQEPQAADDEMEDEVQPAANGSTVLLVEDESALRVTAALLLRRQGYQVFEAVHGREALEIWASQNGKVDLLLTDVVMPGELTGLELAEHLRGLKHGLRAILMTGYSAEIAQQESSLPAWAVLLHKPFTPGALFKAIRECLEQK